MQLKKTSKPSPRKINRNSKREVDFKSPIFLKGKDETKLDFPDRCMCVVGGGEGANKKLFIWEGYGYFPGQHIFIVTQPKENAVLYHMFTLSNMHWRMLTAVYVCNSA